jgi:hypothetical protein
MEAVSIQGDDIGGICRYDGSPSVYQKAGDTVCSDNDTIAYLEDCQVAFDEISLEGYTWQDAFEDANVIPGCYWDDNSTLITFNSNMDAVNTVGTHIGGLCRYGGSPSVY